jgi:ABC transporter DrrB family efflux protein
MTAATISINESPSTIGRLADRGSRVGAWARDVGVLTRRNLLHVVREPLRLSDSTVQPVLFTVMFVYIFGGSMVLPGGGSYTAFAIGGLLTMNLTTAAMGTAVGLSGDLAQGIVNRFRTLPLARSAILAGRTLSDLLSSALCATIVVATGLAIGWRPGNGFAGVAAGVMVALVFVFALSWLTACIGLVAKDPESAQALGIVVMFPLAFVSSSFAPTQGMPGWLRVVADWNPVSAVAGACRNLFGDPNPAALTGTFPAQHPTVVAIASSLVIIAICAPLASRLLRRRTAD